MGLNLQFGYTGLLNFGHVAFMLAGAYGTAITVNEGGSLWLGLLVGVAAAVVLGLIFGLPTLRLRADYLAIVTIAAAEVLRILVAGGGEDSLTGGVFGIQRFGDAFFDANPFPAGDYGIGRVSFGARGMWVLTVAWALVLLFTVIVALLTRSPWGRVQRAVREDEDAARSLGKNVFAFKLQSLVIGGLVGSLAGAIISIDRQSVRPGFFLPVITFAIYAVVILGGPASRLGPVVGAVFYWFVIEFADGFTREAIQTGWIPDSILQQEDIGAIRFALVGLGLMLLMIFRPQGMLGKRQEVLIDAQ